MFRALIVLGAAIASFSVAQKVMSIRENPCWHCHYLAFVQGQPLTTEKGEPLAFATRAAARAYQASYSNSPEP